MGPVKMIPVVIDTNVLVSALLFGGTPARIIDLWKSERICPFVSKGIVSELLRVFAYPKFKLSEEEIQYLLYIEVLPYFKVISVAKGGVIIDKDPSDDMFLRCARAANADALISGDQYLLKLKSYEGIKIISVSEFIKDTGLE